MVLMDLPSSDLLSIEPTVESIADSQTPDATLLDPSGGSPQLKPPLGYSQPMSEHSRGTTNLAIPAK